MGFWEWMGFENPRDSPKTEQPKEGLPKVTDNVRDSGQTFVFGRSNAGEQVDEKAAMQIPTVYACVRLLAESIAALPLHLYRVTDDNGSFNASNPPCGIENGLCVNPNLPVSSSISYIGKSLM